MINPRDRYLTKKGIELGIEQGKLEIATNLLNDGMPIEKVCKLTELDKKQIQDAR